MRWKKKASELVERLRNEGYLKNKEIINAFLSTPRHEFVTPSHIDEAYNDYPLPLFGGQTISAPHMVAFMTELLEPKKTDKVLEIGSGSGYQAAILAKLVKFVYTIEVDQQLARFAERNLSKTGIKNVKVICGDGSKGYEKEAPYDKIIVTCASPEIFKAWKLQIKENGKIIVPVEKGVYQILTEVIKIGKNDFKVIEHTPCVFVPLRFA